MGVLLGRELSEAGQLTGNEMRACQAAKAVGKPFNLHAFRRGQANTVAGVLLGRDLYVNEELSPSAQAAFATPAKSPAEPCGSPPAPAVGRE